MNNEPLQNVQGQVRGLLSRLPDVPVSSNFTARVMQAVEVEEMRPSSGGISHWNWRFFSPRATVAVAVLLAFAAVAFHQHELSVQRQMAKDVYLVASQQVPSVDALKNFDAIQRMGQTARPDDELLALASDMK